MIIDIYVSNEMLIFACRYCGYVMNESVNQCLSYLCNLIVSFISMSKTFIFALSLCREMLRLRTVIFYFVNFVVFY